MKRFLSAFAFFVALAFGCMVGCNAIFGNAPGTFSAADASVGIQTESDGGLTCAPGTKDCAGVCVDINLPSTGCAGACSACPTPKNAQATCDLNDNSFECGVGACNTGFADCNSKPSDGCESALTSKTSCGSCDQNCVDAGFSFCSPGTGCSNTCNGTNCCGNAPCGTATDPGGDCVDTASNASSCGSCGHDCMAIAGAARVDCVSGSCVVRSCVAGLSLCNGICVPQTDSACGDTCANCTSLAQVCVGGACQGCSGGSTFCGASCCAQHCCGTGPTAVCQGQACACPAGEFQCGAPSDCCASGTQVCCNASQCTTEGNAACGTSCAICSPTSTRCDTTDLPHACVCKTAGDTLCQTTTTPATSWCCAKGMVCGATSGQCNPAPCSGPGQCDLGAGVCGCGTAGNCHALTASPNCGTCGTSCGMAGSCCCAGSADAGATYSCQAGHPLLDAGGTDCTGCNL